MKNPTSHQLARLLLSLPNGEITVQGADVDHNFPGVHICASQPVERRGLPGDALPITWVVGEAKVTVKICPVSLEESLRALPLSDVAIPPLSHTEKLEIMEVAYNALCDSEFLNEAAEAMGLSNEHMEGLRARLRACGENARRATTTLADVFQEDPVPMQRAWRIISDLLVGRSVSDPLWLHGTTWLNAYREYQVPLIKLPGETHDSTDAAAAIPEQQA